MTSKNKKSIASFLRIIGGKFRSRKIRFYDAPGLRPTHDRLRETLFNWLQKDIVDATCLDLFAGSGAMGFEAISRGAASVVFVDNQLPVIQELKHNCDALGVDNVDILYFDFIKDKKMPFGDRKFSVVFLDPPFGSNLISPSMLFLDAHQLLQDGALVYVECELDALNIDAMDQKWHVLKAKKTKKIAYYLIEYKNIESI